LFFKNCFSFLNRLHKKNKTSQFNQTYFVFFFKKTILILNRKKLLEERSKYKYWSWEQESEWHDWEIKENTIWMFWVILWAHFSLSWYLGAFQILYLGFYSNFIFHCFYSKFSSVCSRSLPRGDNPAANQTWNSTMESVLNNANC
jgi:hypothetical protein